MIFIRHLFRIFASDITPKWFRDGVAAALLAPTTVNQQRFYFEWIK
ncbi:MAG: hypothetical protein MJZ29_12695 [Bacteroidaceae bacterium]|nr:hypothetical protein [Bacteroidaceae bacterium]